MYHKTIPYQFLLLFDDKSLIASVHVNQSRHVWRIRLGMNHIQKCHFAALGHEVQKVVPLITLQKF